MHFLYWCQTARNGTCSDSVRRASTTTLLIVLAAAACTEELPNEAAFDTSGGDTTAAVKLTVSVERLVAVGDMHGCKVSSDQQLFCWGSRAHGALGDGKTTGNAAIQAVANFKAAAVSVGTSTTCAITPQGVLHCWGDNSWLAVSPSAIDVDTILQPSPVPQLPLVADVSCTESLCCAITQDRDLMCWGYNDEGNLGAGHKGEVSAPVPVVGLKDVQQVAAESGHSCAIANGGQAWCWGEGHWGQLGDGTKPEASPTAVQVQTLTNVRSIATTDGNSCAVNGDGAVYCWGDGYFSDSSMESAKPVRIKGIEDVAQVVMGSLHVCVRTEAGKVSCWGDNFAGQLGRPAKLGYAPRQEVKGLPSIVALTTGTNTTCALSADDRTFCWGANTTGQTGTTKEALFSPVQIASSGTGGTVTPGGMHTCWLEGGMARCMGGNLYNEVSSDANALHLKPVDVALPTSVTRLSSALGQSCALDNSGHVLCWGTIDAIPTVASSPPTFGVDPPTAISVALSGIHKDSAYFPSRWWDTLASGHMCLLDSQAQAWCRGINEDGQVGEGTAGDTQDEWTKVALTTKTLQVTVGRSHSCARTADGQVHCWGNNMFGQVDPSQTTKSTSNPLKVAKLGGIKHLCSGTTHNCAIANNNNTNSVVCWGTMSAEQAPIFSQTKSGSLRKVNGTGAAVTQLACGDNFACGLDDNGHVYCWGSPTTPDHAKSSAGTKPSNNTQPLQPQLVKNLPKVDWLKAGFSHVCAGATASGKVWCWGSNSFGQIGAKAGFAIQATAAELYF
jgi:alpha-tubulin suppressor-like RCC1 family protein